MPVGNGCRKGSPGGHRCTGCGATRRYPSASGSPLGAVATTKMALFGTPTALTSSSVTWSNALSGGTGTATGTTTWTASIPLLTGSNAIAGPTGGRRGPRQDTAAHEGSEEYENPAHTLLLGRSAGDL